MKKWIFNVFVSFFCLGNAVSYADGIPATFEPLEGTSFSGTLLQFEDENCSFIKEDEKQTISTRQLRQIKFSSDENVPKTEGIEVSFGDSLAVAESVFLKERIARIVLGASQEDSEKSEFLILSENLNCLQEILYQKNELGKSKDLDADWAEIQLMEPTSDILVVLRNGKLSFYYGSVLEIDEKSVRFEHEGDAISVKLKHIFAIRFANNSPSENSPSDVPSRKLLGILSDRNGSHFAVSLWKPLPDEQKIEMCTISGVVIQFPASVLDVLDFTTGRSVLLSSLKPESMEWTPFFAASIAASGEKKASNSSETVSARTLYYAPKMDRGFEGEKIVLNHVEYTHGLELSSRTRLVFRLPGEFRTFKTVLGIDDSVRPAGNAEVTIFADERVLFHEEIRGTDEPKALELDVSDARRLTILVDYGKNLDVSDYVAFADAQLLK